MTQDEIIILSTLTSKKSFKNGACYLQFEKTYSPQERGMINTKIICTIGPASSTLTVLREMYDAGMNIVRLNMSHGDQASHLDIIEKVNRLNSEVPFPIGILLDTQGPEIRTGANELTLEGGQTVQVNVPPYREEDNGCLFVNYPKLVDTVEIGDRISVDSGLVNLKVLEKGERTMQCRVIDGGYLKGRRHVNLPGIHVELPAITQKDRSDILFGLKHGIDFIALSFVRDKNAIQELKDLIKDKGKSVRIIAKIENYEGVTNLEEIIAEVDGIMVARGDLGIEINMEDLPNIQRQIAFQCAIHGKCLIIATHLLESMIENPIPTRAEITDIANAVFEESDAIMLSGETASGKYPVRAIQHMVRTAQKSGQFAGAQFVKKMIKTDRFQHIATAAVQLVSDLGLNGIVAFTKSGRSASIVSSCRPANVKIYAFTNSPKTQKILVLNRSVYPFLIDFEDDFEETAQNALKRLSQTGEFKPGDQVVVIHEIVIDDELVPSIQLRNVFG